jgi:hypothetical protein
MVGLELELIKDRSNMLVCSVRQMTGKKKKVDSRWLQIIKGHDTTSILQKN